MNKKLILTIWKKELKDTIRDRRTLLAMIVMPMVLMPALIIGISKFAAYQQKQAEEKIVKIAIENESQAPELAELVKQNEKIEIVESSAPLEQAVNDEEIDGAVIIPPSFQEKIEAQELAEIVFLKNSTNLKSSTAFSRISYIVNLYNDKIRLARLEKENINPSILQAAVLQTEDIASSQEMGGLVLGFIIPLLIVMWSVLGGQYTAIDISAGEKERKTLEALLLTPAKRIDIVLGKFLAVSTTAIVSIIASLLSMAAAFQFSDLSGFTGASSSAGEGGLALSLSPLAIVIFLIVGILLVFMFSAVILSIAIFAKSYKEAQSYIGPSYLVIILPVSLLNSFPGFKAALWFFALPAVNAMLLFKEALLGDYILSHVVLTVISLVIFSGLALFTASKIYSKETVLFKE